MKYRKHTQTYVFANGDTAKIETRWVIDRLDYRSDPILSLVEGKARTVIDRMEFITPKVGRASLILKLTNGQERTYGVF